MNYLIDCTESKCIICPVNTCQKCLSGYYLYENKSCISHCEDIYGQY